MSGKFTRDARKAQLELEEARKAGTAPPEVDAEGNMINPHMPEYMSKAPWYLDNHNQPGLKHQRKQKEDVKTSMDVWYKRGVRGKANKKFQRGACKNCGATTHKTKDCLERPRKAKAEHTGKNLARDDVIVELDLDYDAKRDRWNGYDASQHLIEMEKHAIYEEERKKIRQEELAAQARHEEEKKQADRATGEYSSDDDSSDDDDGDDDLREAENTGAITMKKETATCLVRTSHRNLRIREDTAKYLLNLDVNSAYYDPKTRSMRADPLAGTEKEHDAERLYRGENYERTTGQTKEFNQLQSFAWESQEKGAGVHAHALPSQAEFMKREFEKKKKALREQTKSDILAKYGGEQHMDSLPKPLLWGQSERYVEYSSSGKVIKGQEKAVARSRYDEDVHVANHTSVWGSFWTAGKWGYACCKQTHRNAYCVADTLKAEQAKVTAAETQQRAAQAVAGIGFDDDSSSSDSDSGSGSEDDGGNGRGRSERNGKGKQGKRKKKKKGKGGDEDDDDESTRGTLAKHGLEPGDVELDRKALKRALKEEQRRAEEMRNAGSNGADRKRKYNSMTDEAVTQEELEAYRLTRQQWDDPMAGQV